MLDDLYQDVILDHFKHPRCQGCVENPSACKQLFNPLCGDQICLGVRVEGTELAQIRFRGKGCSISQASASMMAELCQGKSVSEVLELISQFRGMMRGEIEPDSINNKLNDAIALEGVRKFSSRIKCAVLAWEALEKCLKEVSEIDAKVTLQ